MVLATSTITPCDYTVQLYDVACSCNAVRDAVEPRPSRKVRHAELRVELQSGGIAILNAILN